VETYKKYMNMFENLEDKHYLHIDNEYKNGNFIHNLLKADFDIDSVEYPAMSSDNLLNIV
jgi:beta-xylosidase